jgi:hypothetical protein
VVPWRGWEVIHRVHRARRGPDRPYRQHGAMGTVDRRAADIARRQLGYATRQQLIDVAAISRATIARRLGSGQWSEPMPGVIDLGSHEPSSHRELQGLLLATGPASWVSHRSAAALHRFLDVKPPRSPDILVRRGSHTRVGPVPLHTTARLEADETTVVRGLRCATAARTLLDLAPVTPGEVLERLAADLGRRHPADLRQVGRLIDRYPGVAGVRRLRTTLAVLPAQLSHLGSPLEVLGVVALRRAGAPEPVLQHRVMDANGAVLKRVDAAWPAVRVLVEFDGAAYHDTVAAKAHDEQVRASMRGMGWTVEVLRYRDLAGPRPAEIAMRVRRLLDG